MYAVLAVILLALAAFSVLSFRIAAPGELTGRPGSGTRPPGASGGQPSPVPRDPQLQGFVYVGAAAVTALAVAVLLVGLLGNRSGRAESLAMFGFFTYAIYLAGALLVHRWRGR